MPKMVTAVSGGKDVSIDDALTARDHARQRKVAEPQYVCGECGQPVRPHAAGGAGAAHFEHLERNKACSLSDVLR